MKKLYLTLGVLGLLSSLEVHAQQNPQYTQYMYNMSVVNPAYAGSKDAVSMGALYRKQWAGFDGAPETGTFFINSRVGKKVGV
ncbi:type IX secretion system membrane protein PorP/SprF, partial [Myroides sp. DW712]|uniref:type IX secretion system membrane protein PorP/SprF n=1 Tax=Myroides sp. DW712 TaxID=3389800 RepID=UPI00397D27B2